MKLTIFGAAQTVTGSKHLIEINGQRLLLECGLFQGKRKNTYDFNLNFDFDPKTLSAVLLSHAHIDHSGNLPNLVKNGFDGPIYATHATRDLADIMLKDSGHIHEYDVRYVNKKRKKKGLPPVDPLYTIRDAVKTMPHFRQISYDQEFHPLPGVTARFIEAGHILGSAAILLDLEEKGRILDEAGINPINKKGYIDNWDPYANEMKLEDMTQLNDPNKAFFEEDKETEKLVNYATYAKTNLGEALKKSKEEDVLIPAKEFYNLDNDPSW